MLVRDFLLSRLAASGFALDVLEAAAAGDTELLKTMLGADPALALEYSGDGWTALHLAAAFATPEAVAVLLDGGARVDAVSKNPQQNQPLHAAAALSGNLETVQRLLRAGADVNAVQAGGFTALFSAAASGRRKLAELLIAEGADPLRVSEGGKTAAGFARERGHEERAAWLESMTGT